MASIVRIKRSEVSGNPSTLAQGELAYSGLADNGSNGGDRLYIGMGTETSGNAVNHVVIGGKYFTDQITASTPSNTAGTLVKRDVSGNFSAGTITATLSGNASTATKWVSAKDLSLTGDASATLSSVDGSSNVSAELTLATVNSNVGTFGSATAIPIITTNAKGLVTSVTTAAVASNLNIVGDSGSDSISLLTDTISFVGGTGVDTVVTDNQVSISIGQSVGTTDDVTFNNVTVNGTLSSDDITAANISIAGNAVISGDLTVQGTTTTVNSTTIAVGDLNLTLAKDATNAAEANGAGLTVIGPTVPATLTYSSSDDRWNLNKDLNVGNLYGALQGNAATAAKLQTPRYINQTLFDGSQSISFDTDVVSEGTNNLYFTNTRARNSIDVAAVSGGSFTPTSTYVNGTHVVIGGNNSTLDPLFLDIYLMPNAGFTSNFSVGAAFELSAGVKTAVFQVSSILYLADTDVQAFLTLMSGDQTVLQQDLTNTGVTFTFGTMGGASGPLTYDSSTGIFTFTQDTSDGIEEGTNNLYFTNTRARSALSAGSGINYNSTTGVITAVGTTNRISVSSGTIDIASTYAGQSSITTVGTITSGTWNGTTIAVPNGGTGLTSITSRGIIYGNGTSAVGVTAASTIDGSFLREDASGNPYWSNSIDGGTY